MADSDPGQISDSDEVGDIDASESLESDKVLRDRVPPTYTIIKRIGVKGTATGCVFLCIKKSDYERNKDPEFLRERMCAIKVPNDDDSVEYMKDECLTVSLFPTNKRFVKVLHAVGESKKPEQPYIVMEYISGTSLAELEESGQEITAGFVWHFAAQLAEAILWLRYGVTPERSNDRPKLKDGCHADLHSNNIMLDDRNREVPAFPNVVVIDYGSMRLEDPSVDSERQRKLYYLLEELCNVCEHVHRLAHGNGEPAPPRGKFCTCARSNGPIARNDKDLVPIWKYILAPRKSKGRKQALLELIQTASRRRSEALFAGVASDKDIFEAIQRDASLAVEDVETVPSTDGDAPLVVPTTLRNPGRKSWSLEAPKLRRLLESPPAPLTLPAGLQAQIPGTNTAVATVSQVPHMAAGSVLNSVAPILTAAVVFQGQGPMTNFPVAQVPGGAINATVVPIGPVQAPANNLIQAPAIAPTQMPANAAPQTQQAQQAQQTQPPARNPRKRKVTELEILELPSSEKVHNLRRRHVR